MLLWERIQQLASVQPDKTAVAVLGEYEKYTWKALRVEIEQLSQQLQPFSHRVVALYADNSPAWIVIDLACQLAQVTLLPLPAFFSDQQLQHAVREAGACAIIHPQHDRINRLFPCESAINIVFKTLILSLDKVDEPPVSLPVGTDKITFTSGTTGQPKGVCLSHEQQFKVAQSLVETINVTAPKHLSILPFSTLLENIGGIYVPILAGGTIIALPPATLGFNGSNDFDAHRLLEIMDVHQPNTMILLPELLQVLVQAIEQGWQPPNSFQFVAVGGSRVAPSLIEKAQSYGLPVFQGYGLSECSSVVSLNSPREQRISSVGKPLSHVDVRVVDHQVVVRGNSFLGYIHEPESWYQNEVYTGDLGMLDEQGFLHVNGRKKNVLISSYGRNINPEWVESELLTQLPIQQAVVFGDDRPFCIALLYIADKGMDDKSVQACIEQVNHTLPGYAQIKKWIRLNQPLTHADALLTANGRPVRNKIFQHFQHTINTLYEEDTPWLSLND